VFGFGRKKKRAEKSTSPAPQTASTFVEATGGGWGDPSEVIAIGGGMQSENDFVQRVLENARSYAFEQDVAVGERFDYVMADIPVGIKNPHQIMFTLMVEAPKYGLVVDFIMDEKVTFTRRK